MAVLRRPVAQNSFFNLVAILIQRPGLRLLRTVRVFQPWIDFQFFQYALRQIVFGEHPFHRLDNQILRMSFDEFGRGLFSKTAAIAGVPVVHFFCPLLAGQLDVGRVNRHHKITQIPLGGEGGQMFSPKEVGDLGGRPPQDLLLQINQPPGWLVFGGFFECGFLHLQHWVGDLNEKEEFVKPS